MYKARYYKADGTKGQERELPGSLFDGVVNEGVLHQTVRAHLANRRQGTSAAKTRAQVRGGNRKPWRQKGTGRARHGSIRSPIWEGGGRAFPPVPHSWRVRVPKKVRQLARRSALNSRAAEDRVVLVDRLDLDVPKTKRIIELLEAVGADGKVLILSDGRRENLYLSARNLPDVEVRPLGEESAYDLLWAGTVIIERDALEETEGTSSAREEDGGAEEETSHA